MKLICRLLGFAFFCVSIHASELDFSRIGRTFSQRGPNCFATALKVRGIYPTYRAVDPLEFAEFTKHFCAVVASPRAGDLGVFVSKGYGPIHAYIYLNEDLGLQKRGVDYFEKTPLELQSLDSIRFTFGASRECRRYSKDVSLCENTHVYLRCQRPWWPSNSAEAAHDGQIHGIEKRLMVLIDQEEILPQDVSELRLQIDAAEEYLKNRLQNSAHHDYFSARILSLKKQLEFF